MCDSTIIMNVRAAFPWSNNFSYVGIVYQRLRGLLIIPVE